MARSGGPPDRSASVVTAIPAAETAGAMRNPAPIRPKRTAWRTAVRPQARTDTKTAQDTRPSSAPAARKAMVGIRVATKNGVMATWSPSPVATGRGARSPGSKRMLRLPGLAVAPISEPPDARSADLPASASPPPTQRP